MKKRVRPRTDGTQDVTLVCEETRQLKKVKHDGHGDKRQQDYLRTLADNFSDLKPEAWAAYVGGLVAGYGVGPNGEARNPVIESTAADYKGRVTRFLWMAFRAASTLDATADGFQWGGVAPEPGHRRGAVQGGLGLDGHAPGRHRPLPRVGRARRSTRAPTSHT